MNHIELYNPQDIEACDDLQGDISFNNKISPKMLEAIEQEVINYELVEMLKRGTWR